MEEKQKEENRYQLYSEMIESLDEGCRLILEYDSIPHEYGTTMMYQAESQIIHLVGKRPGITAAEIAALFKKTPSACSQLIRKLRKKGWIRQVRNKENNREYQLYLTDSGWEIFEEHDRFERACYKRSFYNLADFSEQDFRVYVSIQNKLNETFELDVKESKNT